MHIIAFLLIYIIFLIWIQELVNLDNTMIPITRPAGVGISRLFGNLVSLFCYAFTFLSLEMTSLDGRFF